jgi:hypothetical protein
MSALWKSILLFLLNWLDGQLTVLWVRAQVATEANGLMASLLKIGDAPFLGVKLAIGGFAACVLYRCAHLPIARRGMTLVLGIYVALMVAHAATGMSALGWHAPETAIGFLGRLPNSLLAFFG